MNLQKISVTLLAKNSQQHLEEVLHSLEDFDEVLLYDTGSTDRTMEIARSFPNVKIVRAPFIGFGPTHNAATACTKHDWVLSIDSDEIVSSGMKEEIDQIALDSKAVYSFPRNNYFNGKLIKWCGWHPDRQIRLYNKMNTRFSDAEVHEAIIAKEMEHLHLNSPIIHYSYSSISDFLSKMQTYSSLFAKQNQGKRSSSLCKAVLHGMFAFFKSYLLKRGFLGGYEGFVISAYNGHTAYYKYLKLYEANSKLK